MNTLVKTGRCLVVLCALFCSAGYAFADTSFVSDSFTTYAARTNTTVTAPTGIANNDILVALVVSVTSSITVTPPAGFTAFTGFPEDYGLGDILRANAWWKRASGESGDYTFTHLSASTQAWIGVVRGASTSTVEDATPTKNEETSGDTTYTATTITTTVNGSFIVFAVYPEELQSAKTPPNAAPPTFTERLDGDGSGDDVLYVATGIMTTAGATGNESVTGVSARYVAPMFAIRASAGGFVFQYYYR